MVDRIPKALPAETVRRFYDRVGARYDWFEIFEARAKERALELLDLFPGQQVLDAGVGTGRQHRQIEAAVQPGGLAVGLDLSPGMLAVARARCTSPLVQADTRRLPLQEGAFDRLYAAYLLDLIPAADLNKVLLGFRRALAPGGRMVLLSLTEGVDWASRIVMALWKLAFAVSPVMLGGCRPLHLATLVQNAGFNVLVHQVIVQVGMPSEIVVAVPD